MKIGFYNSSVAFPVPAVSGGAVEELEEILIDQNEINKNYDFVLFQHTPTKEQMEKIAKYNYKKTKLVYVKTNKFFDFFIRGINKILSLLHIKKRFTLIYDRKFYKALKDNPVDKLIFENDYPFGIICKIEKLIGRENMYFHFHYDFKKSKKVVNYIGNLISVSQFISNQWENFIDENRISKKVNPYVLMNCVRDEKFSKRIDENVRKEIRQKLGFSDEDFVVIFCGRILKIKGVKELMQAVCEIEDKHIKLLIIGDPHFYRKRKSQYLEDIKKITKDNADRIVFSGYVENKLLYQYYQSADLQVVPSICEDAAPLIVIEGQKSGLPQICTISGGIPEYVADGTILVDKDNNLVESLKKNILKLSKDRPLCKEMGQKNIEQGKLFTCEKYYKDFTDIMEKNNG